MKQKNLCLRFLVLAILIILILVASCNIQSNYKKSSNAVRVTIEGKIICFPSRSMGIREGQECKIGLLADDGKYYELESLDSIEGGEGSLSPAQNVKVSGTFSSKTKYDSSGTIDVDKIVTYENLAGQADHTFIDCNHPPGELPKISSVTPTTAKAGNIITIQGTDLTTTVQFYTGTSVYTYGANDGVQINAECSQTTIKVPSELHVGSYTLKIYKAKDKISNGIDVTIITTTLSTKIVPPAKGLYLGQNKLSPTDIATFENSTGRKVALWSPYNVMQGQEEAGEGTLSFDAAAANKAWNDGYIVMVGAYEASPVHKGFNVDRLLKGNYDSDLKKLAAQFRAFGKPMFFSTAREPNGVLAAYMGGFGPDGNESFGWAIQNNKGLAEFNPSKFPNPQLYVGLGNSNVCDGLERLAAAQRYYYDFFIRREKINFLTFDTMGWAVPITESDEPKDSVIYKCSDFGQFYSGIKNYNDWVSINWYMYKAGTEPPLQDYSNALNNLMTKIKLIAPNKPVLITELGFCGANRTEKVKTGLSEIMKYPEIKGFALWGSSQEGGYEGGSFPDCLIGPNTPEGDAFKKIINTNQNFFQSCAYFSDGTKIPNCEASMLSSIPSSTPSLELNKECNVGDEYGKICDSAQRCSTGEFIDGCCIGGSCTT